MSYNVLKTGIEAVGCQEKVRKWGLVIDYFSAVTALLGYTGKVAVP